MSPRKTRAGTTEQSVITTRARAQKLNNANEDAIKSTEKMRRTQRREKTSSDIKNNLEINNRQSTTKVSPNVNVKFSKSARKKVPRQKQKLIKGAEDENKIIAHENRGMDSNESIEILKDMYSDNICKAEPAKSCLVYSSNLKNVAKTPDKTSKKRKTAVANVKISPSIITPKSTPIKLSLTPHRSTKTPKKSPISLGSPKTHSETVPRLLKTPRRLSLTPGKNLNKSDSDSYDKKLQTNKRDSLSKKSLSPLIVKSKRVKSSVNLNKALRKFSKSPKIVLRSPKSPKSKKSKSSKLELSPSRIRKRPLKKSLTSTILTSDLNTTKSLETSKKIPRKLSLTPGKNLNKSDSDSHDKKLQTNKRDSLSKKSLSPLIVKSKRIKSSVNLNKALHKFSKSPKIVLRSPKSKKSKSTKLELLSPSQIRKCPLKKSLTSTILTPDLNTTKSLETSKKRVSSPKDKNLLIKRRLLDSRLMKTLTAKQIKDVLAEPIVLLERLSFKNVQTLLTVGKNQSDILFNVENNSKILTPTTRRKTASDMFMQLKRTRRNSANSMTSDRSSSSIKHDTPIQGKNRKSSLPLTSTPREETMSLIDINTSVLSEDEFPNRSRYKNQSVAQLSNTTDQNNAIENVSKSPLFDKDISGIHLLNSFIKQNATFDINKDVTVLEKERENKKDITYELKQPQTPNLRQMIKKRTMTDTVLNVKEDVKRACKVHFTNLTPGKSSIYNNSIIRLTKLQYLPHNDDTGRSTIANLACKSEKVSIPKFSRNSLVSPSKAKSSPTLDRLASKTQLNKKLHSLNTRIPNVSLNRIYTTPKPFASIEKKSEKKSSVKKMPNFGRIHEKMFAKGESLVDAKKRLADRHLAFTTNKVGTSSPKVNVKKEEKPLPTDTNNGTHNRFGFKLRKTEATHVILKKQTVFSRQKQQHETRMVLKGVRTNRRFEMQMKARNINT